MPFDSRLVANVGVLAAIVEGGSFARAAQTLGLTPSGVSRSVARLEARIGVRLLDRTTRSVTLTDEGRRLYAEIGPLLNGIADAFTQTANTATVVRGRLRVNVDAFFSRFMLSAHIGRFLERYPEISLDLITRDQLGDLVAEGFDIAVRFGEPPLSSLVARKLMDTSTICVASPAYIRQHGHPEKPSDLVHHMCIQMRNSLTGQPIEEWEFRRGRQAVTVKTTSRLLVNEVGTMLGACLSGFGIARIKAIGVQDLLERGDLVNLFPDWPSAAYPIYALYPSRHLPAAKVRAFIDFVQEVLRQQPDEVASVAKAAGF